jgi:GH15 family glucan-1,4-alpha-glucosidase
MCWVALDRAVRLAFKRSLPAPVADWTRERDLISDDIWENFRHPTKGYFVQSKGSHDVDASLLMMPLMRFVSATDPVWLATMDAIHAELSDDGMIFRYKNSDGLKAAKARFCLAPSGTWSASRAPIGWWRRSFAWKKPCSTPIISGCIRKSWTNAGSNWVISLKRWHT